MKIVVGFLVLPLVVFKVVLSASNKAHREIDSFYDNLDERESDTFVNLPSSSSSSSLGVINEPVTVTRIPSIKLNNLSTEIIACMLSYCEEIESFSKSCHFFRNIVSGLTDHRVYHFNFQLNNLPTNRLVPFSQDGPTALHDILVAFGNGEARIDLNFLAHNLELALFSSAFRDIFHGRIWPVLRDTEEFKRLSNLILMQANDHQLRRFQVVDPEIESFRRALLLILSSLPARAVEDFFETFNSITFLTESTESVFNQQNIQISKRIGVLPVGFIVQRVLPRFGFDSRLCMNLVESFLKTGQHNKIQVFLSFPFPDVVAASGRPRIGLVDTQSFLSLARQHLNILDAQFLEIIARIQKNTSIALYFPSFFCVLTGIYFPGSLTASEAFHLAVLNSSWSELESIEDVEFSHSKDDSDFLDALIVRDPSFIDVLLTRCPRLAAHRVFLLNHQFQGRHFASFSNLRQVRIELKRTIFSSEVTRAHIVYLHDRQERLFHLLLFDSSERIAKYFSMDLKGAERKRYKEHPSFNIALTTLDICYELRMERAVREQPEYDSELILKDMLMYLDVMPRKAEDYFELAHELPSVTRRILVNFENEEGSLLLLPEAAALQNPFDIDLLSRTISLKRLIRDGTSTQYRLVLNWFAQFAFSFVNRVMSTRELKLLLKGAAFRTAKYVDSRRLKFNLDPQDQDEPLSLTYKYALIIVASQCKGHVGDTRKRLNNLFPGGDLVLHQAALDRRINRACRHYRNNAEFFSKFKFVATNSRSERFLIDFIKLFIQISNLIHAPLETIKSQFFSFIAFEPENETLFKDHFTYFIILASF